MRLADEILRLSNDQTYPAYVWSAQMAAPGDSGSSGQAFFELNDQLRAIVEPGTNWGANEEIVWRSRTYTISSVMTRMRHGAPHHITMTMMRT